MSFGLLLQQLPHIQESRVNYDAVLSLHAAHSHWLADWWCHLLRRVSQAG